MSVREQEEERRKKTCSSSGLGLAAAAIGVGVGAALYYFLNKRPEENRESGASSSEDWSYEQQQTFNPHNESYSTPSEYTTTDTSINDSIGEESYTDDKSETGIDTNEEDTADEEECFTDDESETGIDTSEEDTTDEISDSIYSSDSEVSLIYNGDSSYERSLNTDWDVTDSSQGVPEVYPPSTLNTICHHIVQVFSPNVRNRERSWTLEECSICFDVMLQDQDLLALPCTHRFHVGCIGPWLEAQQTCPNCRKSAE